MINSLSRRFLTVMIISALPGLSSAQKNTIIIKANSNKLSIRDGNDLKKDAWTITPEARPDVYETLVDNKVKQVSFITDIDSVSFAVKPGRKYDFIILLNGKDSAYTRVSGIALPVELTKKQMSWLQQNSTSFSGTAGSDEEFSQFGKIAGTAQVVALGESTHGTSEFFSIKHRMLRYAVENMGFRVFAIEDNQLQVEVVNNYVLYGKGDIKKIMYGMFSIWIKQEMIRMIQWMRQYNIDHPGKTVEFVGFDMQDPKLALDSLSGYLKRKDPALLAEIDVLLAGFKKGQANDHAVADSIKKEWMDNTRKAYELLNGKKNVWLAAAANEEERTAAEWAVQNANVIKQCALNKYLQGHGNILYRDSAMAENISWILSRRPAGTRMIVWAHDFHISRGDDPVAANNFYGGISMGSWLSKHFGDNYKAFGLETFSGTYNAYPSYTDYSKTIDCALTPSPTGSLDKGLHEMAVKRKAAGLILDMTGAKNGDVKGRWLLKPLFVRAANHVCIDQQYGLKHSVPYQFDGIIFIDRTTGSKPVQ